MCEKKHEQICSRAYASLKYPLKVWDCHQRSGVNGLIKPLLCKLFFTQH